MSPIVDGLEEEFSGEITVFRLNAVEQESIELMQEYGVRGHPSFVVLADDGRARQTFLGIQSEADLRAALQSILPE